jgi:hypothetical protein
MDRNTAALAAWLLFVSSAAAVAGQTTQPAPRQPDRGVLPPQPATTSGAPARQPVPSTPASIGTAPATKAPAVPSAPTTPSATAPATLATPAKPADAPPPESELGAPVYPSATFLGSYDAGAGQRYFLFGTTATYSQVIAFYRGALKAKGDEVFDIPPVWSFDTGRYREQTMVYPPSVTIRDHAGGPGRGYLHAAGGPEGQRFATVIQIVPPGPGEVRR